MYKVSVLVPVYNTERTLKKCLDSILQQTIIDKIEIVIVNDGSTDNSENIINEYLNKYRNISYFRQYNQGLGATRNKGIELAKGDYIAFLDSDDWVDNNYYEKMLNKAKIEESDLVISSYLVEILNKDSKNLVTHCNDNKFNYLNQLIMGKVAGFSWNKLYKKSLIVDNNLIFPIRGELENVEDQYFSTRCVALCNKISFMNESNVHYIVNSTSIVRKYQNDLYKDILMLYRSNSKFFNEVNIKNCNNNILLLRGLITIINNEFKPTRTVDKREKINLINKVININEYKNSLRCINDFNFRKIDKLYLDLIIRDKITTLYYLAKFRCKLMNLRSGIY